jgi:hypothetical protein
LSKVAAERPPTSIAAATGGHAEMLEAYSLLSCDEVTAAALRAPPGGPISRFAAHRRVVISQDNPELGFTHMCVGSGGR